MTAEHEEHRESAGERSTTGRGSSSERTGLSTGTMGFREMWKMMDGITEDEVSRMMRECCPDESDCEWCKWLLRRMSADSRDVEED